MRELRVDIGGSSRGFQTAINEAVGIAQSSTSRMDEITKRSSVAYAGFWEVALDKRAAAELILTEKRLAEIKRVQEAELAAIRVREEAMERAAANYDPARNQIRLNRAKAEEADIAGGSGGLGWRKDDAAKTQRGLNSSGAAGSIASQAAMDAMNGGFKEAGKNAAELAAGLHIAHMAERVMEGKNPLAGLAKLPHHIMEVVEGLSKWAPLLARITGVTAAIVGSEEIIRASIGAARAANASSQSNKLLGGQTGDLRGRLGSMIDDKESSGELDKQKGEALRSQLSSHEGIVRVQRELLALQNSSAEKDAQSAAHKATLAELEKYIRDEAESTVNAQTRLAMLLGDERDLKKEIAKAGAEHDEQTFFEKSKALFAKEREIFETTARVTADADKKKVAPERGGYIAQHVDSLSSAGLFQSVSATRQNPMLDVAKRSETHLAKIVANTRKPHQGAHDA